MGLASILFVYLADEKWENKNVYKSNLFNSLILGFIGFAVVFLLAPFVPNFFNVGPELAYYIRIQSLSILFAVPFLSADSALIYYDKVKSSVYILFFTNVLKLLLLVWSIQWLQSMEMIFWSMVLVSFIQLFWANSVIPKRLKNGLLQLKLSMFQLKDGFYLGFSKLLGVLLIYTDSIMVGAMLTVEDYAIYRNGAIEIPFLSVIYGSVATILLPEISKLFSKKEMGEIAMMKRKAINSTAAIIYPPLLFFLIFSYPLITAYLSEKYALSATVFLIYNLIVLLRINNYHDIIINSNKRYLLLRAYSVCLLGNALLNYIMINYFGYIGAAIASVFSIFSLLLYLARLSTKIIGKSITSIFDFPLLFRILMPPLIVSASFYFGYRFLFPFKISLPFIGVAIVLFSYWIYWKKNWIEKRLVFNLVTKIPLIGEKIGTCLSKL